MSDKTSYRIWVVIFSVACVTVAHGQHTLQRTLTVDPSGNADFTTIQAAINDNVRIGPNPTVRYTILIYGGTYNEAVTLPGAKENVDLVGIDQDSVVIAPTSGNGITITSGAETSRNNRIANLTIQTTSGHGIEIVKGTGQNDKIPKDIVIDGVTISAEGTDKQGINASEVDTLTVVRSSITTADGHGIEFIKPGGGTAPQNIVIENVTIAADGADQNGIEGVDAQTVRVVGCTVASDDKIGIHSGQAWTIEQTASEGSLTDGTGAGFLAAGDDTVLRGCQGKGKQAGLKFGVMDGCQIDGCFFTGASGVNGGSVGIGGVQNVTIRDSYLFGDYNFNTSQAFIEGFVADSLLNDNWILKGCRIEALTDGNAARAVFHDTGEFLMEDCQLIATNLHDDPATGNTSAIGIAGPEEKTIIGCSFETSSAAEKETLVLDLRFPLTGGGPYNVSQCSFSKWFGPIASAERPQPTTQRTLSVGPGSATAVLATTLLTGSEQSITAGITDPDVYRVLTIRGTQAGMSQTVYLIGTNWADQAITEALVLIDTSEVIGLMPFKSVTKIILPAQTGALQSVSVGTSDKLGLYQPISATTDVIQQARKASAATSYTIETPTGTVDAEYSTVLIGTITSGDSFEWAVLASQ